jgi:hypothetical protein
MRYHLTKAHLSAQMFAVATASDIAIHAHRCSVGQLGVLPTVKSLRRLTGICSAVDGHSTILISSILVADRVKKYEISDAAADCDDIS